MRNQNLLYNIEIILNFLERNRLYLIHKGRSLSYIFGYINQPCLPVSFLCTLLHHVTVYVLRKYILTCPFYYLQNVFD